MKNKLHIFLIPIASTLFLTACSPKQQSNNTTPQPQQTEETSPPIANSPDPVANVYTLEDVAEHASETDCWMVIEGNVYDVTSFVGEHPGGKAILNGCGKDATTLFNERPTNDRGPHPAQAKEQLKNFEIGTVAQ